MKDCRDIYASFDKYCEVEVLEGENQYNAEQHGMQVRRVGAWGCSTVATMPGQSPASGAGQCQLGSQQASKQSSNMTATFLSLTTPPPPRRSCSSVLQDARKGILFEGFPPVLQLQLKRFEYDFMKDVMIKVRA